MTFHEWISPAIIATGNIEFLIIWDSLALAFSCAIFIGQLVCTGLELNSIYSTEFDVDVTALLKANLAFSILDLIYNLISILIDSWVIWIEKKFDGPLPEKMRLLIEMSKYALSLATVQPSVFTNTFLLVAKDRSGIPFSYKSADFISFAIVVLSALRITLQSQIRQAYMLIKKKAIGTSIGLTFFSLVANLHLFSYYAVFFFATLEEGEVTNYSSTILKMIVSICLIAFSYLPWLYPWTVLSTRKLLGIEGDPGMDYLKHQVKQPKFILSMFVIFTPFGLFNYYTYNEGILSITTTLGKLQYAGYVLNIIIHLPFIIILICVILMILVCCCCNRQEES